MGCPWNPYCTRRKSLSKGYFLATAAGPDKRRGSRAGAYSFIAAESPRLPRIEPCQNLPDSTANGRQNLPIDWVHKLHGIELPACNSDGGAKPHAWAGVNLTASAEARQTFALLAATHPVAIGGKFVLKAAALPQQERGGFFVAQRGRMRDKR